MSDPGSTAGAPDGSAGGPCVLVIDDERALRSLAARMLETLGYDVLLAGDGREGLEIFDRHRDRVDAVVLDMVLPGLSGREVLERLRAERPDVGVLLSSGYPEDPGMADWLAREGVDFLQKPYRRAEIADRLARVLSSRA